MASSAATSATRAALRQAKGALRKSMASRLRGMSEEEVKSESPSASTYPPLAR
ncbi:hypothetical protein CBOM_01589 [Ceraceosorus bombacis]|uniref:Uncharacterized protein n=1 Tax=Ceraceosorus bombacis TaxID=401625 RepID=A0A0P1BCS3_9BASI|nr:hypothetical protein CBOM_01589 [Ceraceosorus bombacis]